MALHQYPTDELTNRLAQGISVYVSGCSGESWLVVCSVLCGQCIIELFSLLLHLRALRHSLFHPVPTCLCAISLLRGSIAAPPHNTDLCHDSCWCNKAHLSLSIARAGHLPACKLPRAAVGLLMPPLRCLLLLCYSTDAPRDLPFFIGRRVQMC